MRRWDRLVELYVGYRARGTSTTFNPGDLPCKNEVNMRVTPRGAS